MARVGLLLSLLVLGIGQTSFGQYFSLTQILDTDTPVALGLGPFESIDAPVLDGENMAFSAVSGRQEAIYKIINGQLGIVATLATPMPGTGVLFEDFGSYTISGDRVAFAGTGHLADGTPVSGIYVESAGVLTRIADTLTPVPDDPEGRRFSAVSSPWIDGDRVAFNGDTEGTYIHGVYLDTGTSLRKVADSITAPPGAAPGLAEISPPSVSGGVVAFRAWYYGSQAWDSLSRAIFVESANKLFVSVDITKTLIPGGQGTFTALDPPIIDDNDLVFGAIGDSQQAGLYKLVNGVLSVVVDRQTRIPGSMETFTGMSTPSMDAEHVAFSGDLNGIYTDLGGSLKEVISSSRGLPDGRQIRRRLMSAQAISGDRIAFVVTFFDLSSAIFIATFNEPEALPPPPERVGISQDFDGDGIDDIAVFEPATGIWYILQSQSGAMRVQQWGYSATTPVPGDYDGDGASDVAVFEPSTGNWYILPSSTGVPRVEKWGDAATVPVPSDYDGDGKMDLAVFEPLFGNWYLSESSTGDHRSQNWGYAQTIPVPGNYDGVGGDDIAVYEPSSGKWYIPQSGSGELRVQQWGYSGTTPVPGDYDGDGRTDIAVYEPATGNWYVLKSSDGLLMMQNWGYRGTRPVPGLFDADAQYDITVYESATGNWYTLQSTDATLHLQQWGYTGTVPAF